MSPRQPVAPWRAALGLVLVYAGLLGVTPAATTQTEVPDHWRFWPSELGIGDEFRLLFVTSTERDAISTSIANYNTFVQSAAVAGHSANDDGDGLANRRFEMRLGYGLFAFGDRFTSTPEAGLVLSNGSREYSLGWKLERGRRSGGIGSLELALEARRRESANDDAPAEHALGVRLVSRF